MIGLREAVGDLRNIARYSYWETRRAYRDVGPYTAAHVAVAVPAHLLRLWWRDKVRGADRAQLTTPPIIRHLIATTTGVLILILIYAEYGLVAVGTVLLLVVNISLILSAATGWPIRGAQMR